MHQLNYPNNIEGDKIQVYEDISFGAYKTGPTEKYSLLALKYVDASNFGLTFALTETRIPVY